MKDCYPRSLYLLGVIDAKLKEAISAENFKNFSSTSYLVNQVLVDKFNVPIEQVEQFIQPRDFHGDIYSWAQKNIPLNSFVLIILDWNKELEAIYGPSSHALLMGKVKLDRIDISSRPRHDRLNEEEIIFVDTQVGDILGEHHFVYNIGEKQIHSYLERFNFKKQNISVLRLRLDLADIFARLSL